MEQDNRKKPEVFFRQPPYCYNCAQSILAGNQEQFGITQQEIDDYAPYKGGRAPEGCCGALYAANQLLSRKGLGPVTTEFVAVAGAEKCIDIKGGTKFPCIECVRLADKLIQEKMGK